MKTIRKVAMIAGFEILWGSAMPAPQKRAARLLFYWREIKRRL